MLIAQGCYASAARSTRQKAYLHKIRLIHILNGNRLFAYCRSQGLKTDRTAAVGGYNGCKHTTVKLIKTQFVNLKAFKRLLCYIKGDHTVKLDLRNIAHAAKQTVCNTRCTSRARGNLQGALAVYPDTEYSCRAGYDPAKLLRAVQLKTQQYAEAVTKRSSKLTRARSSAYKRKMRNIKSYRARRGTFSENYIKRKIFHSRIKYLLNIA